MSSGGQIPWRSRQRAPFDAPRRTGVGRLLIMGGILLGLAAGVWLLVGALCGSSCNNAYCATSLDVDPPEGFRYASDVYEYRGTPPEIPTGGTIEVDIALDGDLSNPGSLNFYRFIAESSAWELVTSAVLDDSGDRAGGVFSSLPATLVIMERVEAKQAVIAYLRPGEQLHPDAMNRATTVLMRGLRPAGDGGITGEAPRGGAAPGAAFYPVLEAGTLIEGSLASVDAILSEPSSRTAHVQRIVEYVVTQQLDGINVAYMDLRADQRLSFALFVEELGVQMRKDGKVLSLTLPAPVRTPERVDTGAYDWQVLGAAAEFINIAPVRDQSTYRTDMPVVLDFLKTLVDARKLNLTVTPYAAERGTEVRALTLTEAMTIASRIGIDDADPATSANVQVIGVNIDSTEGLSGVLWDSGTATVAFTYKDDGGRTVWLENSFSVGFKLEFVTAFGLGGFAVEDASDGAFLGDIWAGIAPFVDTGTPVLGRPNTVDLEPQWKISAGTMENVAKGVVRWTTPSEPGTYTINLTLSDGVYFFDSQVNVQVQPRQPGTGGG